MQNAGKTIILTCLCTRMNSRGSLLAQGGRTTSFKGTPFCLEPRVENKQLTGR